MTKEEKIKELEEELKKTKYNKRTQHHVGLLKARIARLKQSSGSSSSAKPQFSIKKTGDATVILIGPPSVGKSSLLNKITNADTKIASYKFTTLKPVPGVLEYESSKIQIVDLPGIIEGASKGKGRGREVLSALRVGDMVVILLDNETLDMKEKIEKELYSVGIRLNEEEPKIKLIKMQKGGLKIHSNLDKKLVVDILKEFKINNGDISMEKVTVEQLIDFLEGNKVYIPGIVVVNKSELLKKKSVYLDISVEEGKNLEKLKKEIFDKLNLMKVYLKRIGKEADMEEPLIVKKDSSVKDVCLELHKEFLEKFTKNERFNRNIKKPWARVWGTSVKHDGMRVNVDHILHDRDILEVHRVKK